MSGRCLRSGARRDVQCAPKERDHPFVPRLEVGLRLQAIPSFGANIRTPISTSIRLRRRGRYRSMNSLRSSSIRCPMHQTVRPMHSIRDPMRSVSVFGKDAHSTTRFAVCNEKSTDLMVDSAKNAKKNTKIDIKTVELS